MSHYWNYVGDDGVNTTAVADSLPSELSEELQSAIVVLYREGAKEFVNFRDGRYLEAKEWLVRLGLVRELEDRLVWAPFVHSWVKDQPST